MRRFILTPGEVTVLTFPVKRVHGIDIFNLSSTDTIYFQEDAPVSSSDTESIKLLPGVTYTFTREFTELNFLSAGAAEVQAIVRGNKL